MARPGFEYMLFVIAALASAPAVAATATPIYADAPAQGWTADTWMAALDDAHAATVHAGSHAMAVTLESPWAGMKLLHATPLDTGPNVTLRFAIHGGPAGGQRLRVIGLDADGQMAGAAMLAPLMPDAWVLVQIRTTTFNVPQITGLAWQDISGTTAATFYLDSIDWLVEPPVDPTAGPALTVDARHIRGRISPHIYGLNFADEDFAAEIRLPIERWGGNAATRYSWTADTFNHAADGYFRNIPNMNDHPERLPAGSSTDFWVMANQEQKTESVLTVPLIGWTPRSREHACSYSVARYGPQHSVDPDFPDCGDGIRADGTPISNADPADTSVPVGPEFAYEWVRHLVGMFGAADAGGVQFYSLDNEPMLWHETHRDVHPEPVGYDEIRDRSFAYAAAIKAADPGAQITGPVVWGWPSYFHSAVDQTAGPDWQQNPPDRNAHGGIAFIPWYLQQMRAYEQQHGVRLLDYLDVHYYPQGEVTLRPAGDATTQARRLRSTRSLWDPTYVDESWIGEVVQLIPRLRAWVDENYPGTKLAISEYNWGGQEHINGALSQADVLGIFGREGLDMACLWATSDFTPQSPAAFAFRMYRNYDGAGGAFADGRLDAVSADAGRVSIFAARDDAGHVTIMLINKDGGLMRCPLTIEGTAASVAQVYRYSEANLARIVREADQTIEIDSAGRGAVELALPGSSITLLVLPARIAAPEDLDADGDVDADDAAAFMTCRSGPAVAAVPACRMADFDGDMDVDQDDFGRLQRCLAGPNVPVSPACGN